MGRAVGGAGAGCAGFGLLGVLVSVAIVVWLGSQGLGLGGGGDGRDGGRSTPPPTDARALLDALDTTTSTRAGPIDPTTGPAVLVGDGAAVAAGAPVVVRASGVAPGAAAISVCALPAAWVPGDLVDADRCGPPVATVDATPAATVEATVTAPGRVATPAGEVDCAAEPCWVVVQPTGGVPAGAARLQLAA